MEGRDITPKNPHRKATPMILFIITNIYFVAFLTFYGIFWMWGSLRAPGPRVSVVQMSRIRMDFQANLDVPDALLRPTTCLENNSREHLSQYNTTVADVTACLKDMGMQ